jgi:hypothetical protein
VPEKVDDLMAEAAQFRREHKVMVLPVLIYLVGECPPAEAVVDMTTPTGFGMRHAPLLWPIAQDDAAATLDALAAGEATWGVLFWLPLMSGADDDRMVARWRAMVDALPDERRRRDVMAICQIFAGLAGRGQLWRRNMEGWTTTESPIVNEWMAEVAAESEITTLRKALTLFLRGRFRTIPEDVAEAIRAQPSREMLEEWAAHAGTVDSMEAVRDHLRR